MFYCNGRFGAVLAGVGDVVDVDGFLMDGVGQGGESLQRSIFVNYCELQLAADN